MASAKTRKCEATNDAECLPKFGRTSAEQSHVAEPNRAEPSAEFFGRTSASAELRPISNRKSTTRFPLSLRWSSYVAPKTSRGGEAQERKMGDFRLKSHCAWRKSATKFLCVKTVNGNLSHSLANHAKIIGGFDPFYLKFWIKLTALERNRRFPIYFIFARSDSAVTPSEKGSINTR